MAAKTWYVPLDIRGRIATAIKDYIDLASRHYGRKYVMPQVEYTLQGRTAGVAIGTNEINFNAVLLMENVERFIARTVPHEVAHCVDLHNQITNGLYRYGERRSAHGESWKYIMRLFGVQDISRTHSYDTTNSARPQRRYPYKCSVCGEKIELSGQRHNKIRRGATFHHTVCGSSSRLVYDAPHNPSPMRLAAQMPAPKLIPSMVAPRSMFERCRIVFDAHPTTTRRVMLSMFGDLGCSPNTAKQYYQKLKG
jgi:SprT protein